MALAGSGQKCLNFSNIVGGFRISDALKYVERLKCVNSMRIEWNDFFIFLMNLSNENVDCRFLVWK